MTPDQIIQLGIDMRTAQRAYFRVRSPANLERAKKLEHEFDEATRLYREGDRLL